MMKLSTSIVVNCKLSAKLLLFTGFVAFILNVYNSSYRFRRFHRSANRLHPFSVKNHSIGKVFIAVNLYQSQALLEDGSWARTMTELIDELGPDNVYLSIFENNSTDATPRLLHEFKNQLKCRHTVVTTTINVDEDQYSTLFIRDRGQKHLSRIAYLAMIRNHALKPLMSASLNLSTNESRRFSKLLFINDVVFSTQDAIRLLQTNGGDYAAACGLDFNHAIKFYDTFATRDANGYSMGIPLYPYFPPGASQLQIRQGRGLVRVQSCWSGMVAFDSAPFENGLQFRSLHNVSNYEASECCLVHADIGQPNRTFLDPKIEVTYSKRLYKWRKRLVRFDSIFLPIQKVITYLANLPRHNEYRTSSNGGFCWRPGKLLLERHNTQYSRVD